MYLADGVHPAPWLTPSVSIPSFPDNAAVAGMGEPEYSEITDTAFTITWDAPTSPNGQLFLYTVAEVTGAVRATFHARGQCLFQNPINLCKEHALIHPPPPLPARHTFVKHFHHSQRTARSNLWAPCLRTSLAHTASLGAAP